MRAEDTPGRGELSTGTTAFPKPLLVIPSLTGHSGTLRHGIGFFLTADWLAGVTLAMITMNARVKAQV
jgi:hypothetical protein